MNIVYSALKYFSKNATHIQEYLNLYQKNPRDLKYEAKKQREKALHKV